MPICSGVRTKRTAVPSSGGSPFSARRPSSSSRRRFCIHEPGTVSPVGSCSRQAAASVHELRKQQPSEHRSLAAQAAVTSFTATSATLRHSRAPAGSCCSSIQAETPPRGWWRLGSCRSGSATRARANGYVAKAMEGRTVVQIVEAIVLATAKGLAGRGPSRASNRHIANHPQECSRWSLFEC